MLHNATRDFVSDKYRCSGHCAPTEVIVPAWARPKRAKRQPSTNHDTTAQHLTTTSTTLKLLCKDGVIEAWCAMGQLGEMPTSGIICRPLVAINCRPAVGEFLGPFIGRVMESEGEQYTKFKLRGRPSIW